MPSNRKRSRRRSPGEWFNAITESFELFFHRLFTGIGQVLSGIGALVFPRRLVDGMRRRSSQRALKRANKESKLGKSVEKFEDRVHVFTDGVKTVFSDIFKLFVPTKLIESTEKAVSQKSATVFWDIRYRLKKFGERFAPKWLTTRIGKLYDAFASFLKFCRAWATSRDYMALAWSLPAFLMALPIASSFVGNIVYSSSNKIQHYQSTLATAIEERDENVEKLCFDKLSQLGYERIDRSGYASAITLAEEGKYDEAVERMREIAPLEEAGFPLAHLWLAREIANGSLQVEDAWSEFETHSKHALAESYGRYLGVRELARRYVVEADLHYGRTDKVIAELTELVKTYPSLHGVLMDQYVKKGDADSARRHARSTLSYMDEYQRQRQKDLADADASSNPAPPLTPVEYVQWAMAAKLAGGTKKLAEVVDESRLTYPDDDELHTLMLEQMVSQAAALPFSNTELRPLLEEIVKREPGHRVVVLKLYGGVLEGKGPARACVDAMERNGTLPVEVLVRLGDTAAGQQDRDTALSYYQRASRMDPNQMRVWNNMAHVLSQMEPVDLELAQQAISKAIALDPDPRSLETRGQIMIKLGRWEEAISDLEQSLNGALPNPTLTHQSLAKAYSELGNEEQAAAHRRQVRESQ